MITGIVTGQKLKLATPVVAADSVRFLTAEFSLSPEWSGRDVYCHFWQDDDHNYVIKLEANRITEEQHLDLTAGMWVVWLHGNRTEADGEISRATSTKAALQVVESGLIDGDPFPELEPSVVEQLLQRCEAATRAAEDAARDAGASKTAAENAAGNATQAANSAAGSATRAGQSATSAAGSATSAAGAANLAAQKATEAETAARNAGTSKTAAETAAGNAAGSATRAGDSEREARKAATDAAAELGKTYTKTEIDDKIRQATPADYENVKKQVTDNATAIETKGKEIEKKIDKPAEAPEAGKVLRVKSVNPDGTFVVEWADAPSAGVDDVQIAGKSITQDGVANIPIADNNNAGVARFQTYYGTNVGAGGTVVGSNAIPKEQYATKPTQFFVSKAVLDGVLASPSIMPALTAEEQTAALERLGLNKEWEEILRTKFDFGEEVSEIVLNLGSPKSHVRVFMFIKANEGACSNWGLSRCYLNGVTVNGSHEFELGNITPVYNVTAYLEYTEGELPKFQRWNNGGDNSPIVSRNGLVSSIASYGIRFTSSKIDKIVLGKYTGKISVTVYAK